MSRDDPASRTGLRSNSVVEEPGTHPTGIVRNMKRCAALMQAEDELEALEARLRRIRQKVAAQRAAYRTIQVVASLRLVGRPSTWEELLEENPTAAWKKETVLAILSCHSNSNNLPLQLREDQWSKYLVLYDPDEPAVRDKIKLCLDPEILLARIRRLDFSALHTEKTIQPWFMACRNILMRNAFGNNFDEKSKTHITIAVDSMRSKFSGEELDKKVDQMIVSSLACIVSKFPVSYVRYFTNVLCDWKEVATAYVMSSMYTPTPHGLLGRTSKELLGDRELVLLAVTKAQAREQKGGEILKHMHDSLKDSIDFALALLENIRWKVSDFLQHFSPRVRGNLLVAKAFCKADGRNYPHVAFSLRKENEQLARIACKTCPRVLMQHVPGNIERALTKDKKFVLYILVRSYPSPPPNFFSILDPSLKRDREIVQAAVASGIIGLNQVPAALISDPAFRNGLIRSEAFVLSSLHRYKDYQQHDWSIALARVGIDQCRQLAMQALLCDSIQVEDIPTCWAFDKSFWRAAVERKHNLWTRCPFAGDIAFAKSLDVRDMALVDCILESFPSLSSDLAFWKRLLKHKEESFPAQECLTKHASREKVLRDKEIMLRAIARYSGVYEIIHPSLKSDRQILEALITVKNARALFDMSMEVREMHPDLVARALNLVDKTDLLGVYDFLEPNEWEREDIALVWLSKGGEWLDDEFPEEFTKDKELMLLVAEHDEKSFHVASDALLKDKDFVLQALSKNGMVYRHVDEVLNHDFDIVLEAWATSEEVGDIFFAREDYRFVTEFAAEVRERLRDQDIFLKTVLCGTSSSGNDCCLLRTLLVELGVETSLWFRKQLAEFLNISTGFELAKLRKASKHLELWGY